MVWQIGFKTPEKYARAYTEYAKVMKWTDPSIKLFASAVSVWDRDLVERAQLLFFWPFIITGSESMMTIPVGITQVNDAFGMQYARTMAVGVLAGLSVVATYLAFRTASPKASWPPPGLKASFYTRRLFARLCGRIEVSGAWANECGDDRSAPAGS